ncbi:hypothetical protein KEM56_001004 [Ascosphaera pollenicola]|nr:hypothetical protein KEM56_001004 [Ascosphaera pollenicola]
MANMALEASSSDTVLHIIKHLNNKDLRTLHLTLSVAKSKHAVTSLEELCKRATVQDIIVAKPLSLVDAAICNNLAAFEILARRSTVLRCRMDGELTILWQRRDRRRCLREHIRNATTLLNVLCVLVAKSTLSNAQKMLKIALHNGASQDVEFQDTRYIVRSCIGFAASEGRMQLLRTLLNDDGEYRRKHHYFTRTLASALAYAIRGHYLSIVKYLTQTEPRTVNLLLNTSPIEFGCKSYLALAANESDLKTFRFILNLGRKERNIFALKESLCRASGAPCGPIVDDLLLIGVKPCTATIVNALHGNDTKIVDKLLERVGHEFFLDEHNIHALLRNSRSRAVGHRLLEHCPFIASVPGVLDIVYDVWDEYNNIRWGQKHPGKEEVAKLLIKRGCLAIRKKNVVNKRTLFAMATLGHTEVLEAVLAQHPQLAQKVYEPMGNLLNAAVSDHENNLKGTTSRTVELLVEHGVNVNSTAPADPLARTPLMNVCSYHPDNCETKKYVGSLVRSFVAGGADINRRDKQGKTALQIAERVGNDAAAEVLIEACSHEDISGGMPQDKAKKRSSPRWSSCWTKVKEVSWKTFKPGERRYKIK